MQDIDDIVNSTAPAAAEAVAISPNPVHDVLNIQNLSTGSTIALMNGLGQEIWSRKNTDTHKMSIQTNHFPAGIYTIQIITANGQKRAVPIIVQH
jgi:hypothetical protein